MTTGPHPMSGMEAFAPKEIASQVETRGVAKANAPSATTFVLGVLAGAFIGLGAVLATTIGSGSTLGYGPTRWLAGLGFSLGLILVVVAGAELFTGNNLIVMSLVSRHITLGQLLRNWGIVYVGNLVGALSIAIMVWLAQWWTQGDDAVGATALTIAASKTSLALRRGARSGGAGERPGVPGGVARGRRPHGARQDRRRSCCRSARSWRPGSSTASPTCTSSPPAG